MGSLAFQTKMSCHDLQMVELHIGNQAWDFSVCFFAAIWVILEIDADRFNFFFGGGGGVHCFSRPQQIFGISIPHLYELLFTINTEHCDL